MKKILILLAALISTAVLSAKEAEVTADKTVTKVTFYSPEIVRVTKTPAGEAGNTRESLVVTMTPQEGLKVTKSENSSAVTLKSPVLTVRIDKKTGLVQFLAKGKNLLKEKAYGFEERTEGPDKGSYRTTIVYQLDKDEPIYGLGVTQDGKLNHRGSAHMNMEQNNTQDYQHVIQSIKGWGIY
jgi:alpha-D-xyloside xylohydrolase